MRRMGSLPLFLFLFLILSILSGLAGKKRCPHFSGMNVSVRATFFFFLSHESIGVQILAKWLFTIVSDVKQNRKSRTRRAFLFSRSDFRTASLVKVCTLWYKQLYGHDIYINVSVVCWTFDSFSKENKMLFLALLMCPSFEIYQYVLYLLFVSLLCVSLCIFSSAVSLLFFFLPPSLSVTRLVTAILVCSLCEKKKHNAKWRKFRSNERMYTILQHLKRIYKRN